MRFLSVCYRFARIEIQIHVALVQSAAVQYRGFLSVLCIELNNILPVTVISGSISTAALTKIRVTAEKLVTIRILVRVDPVECSPL
jgi:hypothetical protein